MPPKRKAGVDIASVTALPAAPPPVAAAPVLGEKATPASSTSDPVSQLVAMGFLKSDSEVAYKQNGSVEKALNALLAGNAPVPQPSAIYMSGHAPPSPVAAPPPKKTKAPSSPPKKPKKASAKKKEFLGKTICFTGALAMVRREAEALATAAGMRVTKTVSSKTDIVVAGPGAGSKLGKAEDHGTTVWSEDEFKKVIGGGSDEEDGGDVDDESADNDASEEEGNHIPALASDVREDEWTGNDCDIEHPIDGSLVNHDLQQMLGPAPVIAQDLAKGLAGVLHGSESDSDWYPVVLYAIPNGNFTGGDVIRAALKVSGKTKFTPFKASSKSFFTYNPNKLDHDDKDNEDMQKEVKKKEAVTRFMQQKLIDHFNFCWDDEQVCFIKIVAGWTPDRSAICGLFAITVHT